MAPPNSAASKKAAKAGAKKIPIEKPGIKKTAKKVVLKVPAASAKTLKTPAVKSKKSPAAMKKVSSAAFDLEAFVKVKFSKLEKTAHQKIVHTSIVTKLPT
jgi:hypothetical protein